MLPLKRILCPTDFSADSRAALKAAGEMALFFSAELKVLHVHVYPQPAVWPYEGLGPGPIVVGPEGEDFLALRRRELEAEAEALLPEGYPRTLEVRDGDPAEVILQTAADDGTDLIVLAPHGRGRLRTALFGSTAEKVVRQSPCPVMTLHAGQTVATEPTGRREKKSRA